MEEGHAAGGGGTPQNVRQGLVRDPQDAAGAPCVNNRPGVGRTGKGNCPGAHCPGGAGQPANQIKFLRRRDSQWNASPRKLAARTERGGRIEGSDPITHWEGVSDPPPTTAPHSTTGDLESQVAAPGRWRPGRHTGAASPARTPPRWPRPAGTGSWRGCGGPPRRGTRPCGGACGSSLPGVGGGRPNWGW